MTANAEVIHRFYTAFQKKDFQTMQACYADHATFSDPVFSELGAAQVRAMWEMFCTGENGLEIFFHNIVAEGNKGSAEWVATYYFPTKGKQKGNKVVNRIRASFVFEDGKIVRHTDQFGFYDWARKALGATGLLLGWAPMVRKKVQKMGMKSLARYMAGKSTGVKEA